VDGVEDLERWAAGARAREAADSRVRERWLRAQAEEESSLAGVLLAMAERRETVVVATVSGRRHRGVLTGVGVDFVALASAGGGVALIALTAVGDVRVAEEGVRPRPGSRSAATTGDGRGRGALGVRLGEVLAQAAGQRPRILLQAGAASVVGDLVAVGLDVVTVRADGTAGAVYVGLASVSEISFLASG
jgi:hypothetical protein